MVNVNKCKLNDFVIIWGNVFGDIKNQKDLIALLQEKTDASREEIEEWVKSQGYLKEHQSLAGYATESWVEGKGYLTEVPSDYAKKTDIPTVPENVSAFNNDAGYATESWVEGKGYLTEHQSLKTINGETIVGEGNIEIKGGSGVTIEEVDDEINSKLTGYATESWVEGKGYLTEHQDISGLATKVEVKAVEDKIPSLDGYAKESWVEGKGYLTEHQPIKTINGESVIGEGNIEISGVTPEQEALINQVPNKVNQVRLTTDGSAIRHEGALTPLTFSQIYDLVMDNSKYVYIVMDNNIRFRPSAYDGDAIWFDSSFIEEGKPNILRCIINSDNRVDITQIVVASTDELEAVEGKIPSLEGYATEAYVDAKIGALETITNEILG